MKRNKTGVSRLWYFATLMVLLLAGAAHAAVYVGSPFPIASTGGQEVGASSAFDGTNYLVGIQGYAPGASNYVTAQLISQSGSLVGSRIFLERESWIATGSMPTIAFDGTNYLVLWSDDHWSNAEPHPDGYNVQFGTLVNKAGALASVPFPIGNSYRNAGSAIFDGTNYFVVWEKRRLEEEADLADIYGQFVTPAGALLGSAIPVSTAAHGQRDPALGFDGTNIIVVWTDSRDRRACWTKEEGGTSCAESDIYGQLISKSSAGAAGSLSGGNFLISASTLPRDGTAPSIAFDGTNYLIAFSEETTLPPDAPDGVETWHVFAQRITSAGAALGGTINIKTVGNLFLPSVAFDGTQYIVTWNDSVNWDVYGKPVSISGAPGSEFAIDNAAGNQMGGCAGRAVNGRLLCIIDTGFDFSIGQFGDVSGVFVESGAVKNDFNSDRKTDILLRNTTSGKNLVWYMDNVTRLSYKYLTDVTDLTWTIVGTGDFNRDGKADILWRRTSNGQNMVWYMNGASRTSYAFLLTVSDQAWTVAGTGDFNSDDKTDILWRNTTTGQVQVWYMDGVTRTSYVYLPRVADLTWIIAGTGDFNRDGKPDILWRNTTTGRNMVWYMDGVTKTSSAYVTTNTDQAWKIVGTGDFNKDGKTDILWRNTTTGRNMVWYMDRVTRTSYAYPPSVSDQAWKIVGK
ncbi:MAG: VCBS repeat-containing protein [Deltaproteobacteria bacterium]